ncbi:unnamed protein product [Brugia timori]|uniref:Uncharacterized protein n=1 Tax=Brugia timori TaxID=42155 RepID=A0A0R3R2N9_9BILA|nr:unnamed protein product [Brugia timori]
MSPSQLLFQKESANDDLSVANLTSLNEITQQSSDEICHFIIFRCLHFQYLFVDVEDFFACEQNILQQCVYL